MLSDDLEFEVADEMELADIIGDLYGGWREPPTKEMPKPPEIRLTGTRNLLLQPPISDGRMGWLHQLRD